jgi:hypothetical protein
MHGLQWDSGHHTEKVSSAIINVINIWKVPEATYPELISSSALFKDKAASSQNLSALSFIMILMKYP